jgi:hypothetical protein
MDRDGQHRDLLVAAEVGARQDGSVFVVGW